MRAGDPKRFPVERIDVFQVSRPIALAPFHQAHRSRSIATFSNATGHKRDASQKQRVRKSSRVVPHDIRLRVSRMGLRFEL